jgi:uncharacterized membrane protein YdjX (TVP38/TMEM64 family)
VKRSPSPKRGATWSKVALALVFLCVIVAFYAVDATHYVNLDSLKANRGALLAFTAQHYAAALALAFVGYVGAVAFSLPVATVLSLAIGFLFGRWVGTALVVTAATVGATLAFLAARYLFAAAARRRAGTLGERINAGISANAFSYLLFLRLVPLFPFFLVNLAAAFTTVRLRTYALATFIGISPGAFVYVNVGRALGRLESATGLVGGETLLALALLGVFALAPIVLRRWKLRSTPRVSPLS